LPVPAGFHDGEMALFKDALILPAIAAFRPDAIVLQCGADAVTEDPQSRLALSNNAHWDVVASLKGCASRYLVLGGGGYNPWSVGRCWTGVWATLNECDIPELLPNAGRDVLRSLVWEGQVRVKAPPLAWIETLRDQPRQGPVSGTVRERVTILKRRLAAWV